MVTSPDLMLDMRPRSFSPIKRCLSEIAHFRWASSLWAHGLLAGPSVGPVCPSRSIARNAFVSRLTAKQFMSAKGHPFAFTHQVKVIASFSGLPLPMGNE